jgi:phosphatidylglycerol:prolipoprotein diacylglycerol transferase
MTHYFDSGKGDAAYTATVRLTGRRAGVSGRPTAGDTFVHEDRIEGIVPGTGPVSITSSVYGIAPGDWTVGAELLRPGERAGRRPSVSPEQIPAAAWSWRRWSLSTRPEGPVATRWAILAPLAMMPGVIPGSWPLLGFIGALVAFATQATILGQENVAVGPSLFVSLVALVSGMIGAKLWYAVLHPGPWRKAILGGWAVDGFLVVAPIVAIALVLASDLPMGRFLDSATPGLFFGVAIGRVGCFLTGCCAGRGSGSRWALWSSDRRVGARRIPAQLLESAAGLAIGATSAVLVLGHVVGIDGAVFVGAFGLYLVVRQALLRVRAESRSFSWRRSRAGATGRA